MSADYTMNSIVYNPRPLLSGLYNFRFFFTNLRFATFHGRPSIMLDSSCGTYSLSTGELNVELFRSSGDCIKILNLDGKLCHLNPGGVVALELTGPDQVLGKVWWSFWPDDSKPLAEAAFNIAKSGVNHQFQAFCPTAEGTARWWDVVTSPIYNDIGQVKEVMVVSRDVTELFITREKLREADQLKDELLATVAHELRNPISAAMTASNLLKLKEFDHGRVTEFASLIQRQLNHMSRITEDLLDAARINRGEITLEMKPLRMQSGNPPTKRARLEVEFST